jgi:hypothetical protein
MLATDLFLVKSVAVGITKAAVANVGKLFAEDVAEVAVKDAAEGAAKTAGTELHHLLPQSKNLAPYFKRAGLNIEDYKIPLDTATHRLLPAGIHTGARAESWNGVWQRFFSNNPGANKQEILDQLTKMRENFGI